MPYIWKTTEYPVMICPNRTSANPHACYGKLSSYVLDFVHSRDSELMSLHVHYAAFKVWFLKADPTVSLNPPTR